MHLFNPFIIFFLIMISNLSKVQVDADLNDFFQEVLRGHLTDVVAPGFFNNLGEQGRNLLTATIPKVAIPSVFSSSSSPKQEYLEEKPEVDIDGPKLSAFDIPASLLAIDKDGDPHKYIKPAKLHSSCDDEIKILNPFTKTFGRREICVPLVVCNSILNPVLQNSNRFCSIPAIHQNKESIGVCCSQNKLIKDVAEIEDKNPKQIPYISKTAGRTLKPINQRYQSALSDATQSAIQLMKNLYKKQEEWIKIGNSEKLEIPIGSQVVPESRDIGDGGLGLVQTTRAIAIKLTGSTDMPIPPASVLKSNTFRAFCPSSTRPSCDSSSNFYRTMDGSCNNPQDITMGQTFQPLIRLTFNAYEDNIYTPRSMSKNKKDPLPSPRIISTTIFTQQSRPSSFLNFGFAEHGQLLAHDLSHVPTYDLGPTTDKNGILCCSFTGKKLDPEKLHPSCFPIDVPHDDTFYAAFGVTCLPVVRSMVSSKQCTIGAGQQLNQATHWMDLSVIYGSLDRMSKSTREFKGGRLKSFDHEENDYLALNSDCKFSENIDKCYFETGDLRANHQLYLITLQTIWLREHNRVAKILASYHPEWSDEVTFQETRRIVIAEFQHITFNEFIPSLIGQNLAKRFKLLPKFRGYTEYQSQIDSSVATEHTTAAYRIGHSMIPDLMKIISKQKTVSKYRVGNSLERPMCLLGDKIMDGAIRGLTRTSMETADQWITTELTQNLFKPSYKMYGQDLGSLNIQRGRDHGIGGYAAIINELSDYCGLEKITSFEDMIKLITPDELLLLKTVYAHYEDVDLYVGGHLESPVLTGGLLGPTFGCIIADQFSRSKFGDRFYYEHGNLPNSFTKAQLQEIRSTSGARIYCDNAKDIERMQPLALRKISSGNPLVNCSDVYSIPAVDLSLWKDYVLPSS